MTIYFKNDKAKGSVTDEGFKDQINLSSFSWGAGIGMSSAHGGDRTHSIPSVSEINVTKQTDKSSEILFKSLLKGESIGKGLISFVSASKGTATAYATLEIQDIIVSGFSISSGGDRPVESVSLNFTKFDWSYTGMDQEHTGSPTHLIYDIMKNKVG